MCSNSRLYILVQLRFSESLIHACYKTRNTAQLAKCYTLSLPWGQKSHWKTNVLSLQVCLNALPILFKHHYVNQGACMQEEE